MMIFNKKKICILIIIVLILFTTTGCWNRKELNDLGMVGTVAIDVEDKNVKLTFELIKPVRADNKEANISPSIYFQSEGETIFDAIRNATLKYDKKLYFSHAKGYLFNEKAGTDGLLKSLDLFNRKYDCKGYVHIVIVKNAQAEKTIGIVGRQGETSSAYIESLFSTNLVNGKSVDTDVINFLQTYYTEGIEPVAGVVQVVNRNIDPLNMQLSDDEKYMLSNEGAAIFKDDKLVGFFDGFETRGYNFVIGKIKSSMIVSSSPDGLGKNSVEVINSSNKLDVKVKDGHLSATVKIIINAALGEETGIKDIANIDSIRKIEKDTTNRVMFEINEAIKKAKGCHSDVFGFGQTIHISQPKEWDKVKDKWNDIFSKMGIVVNVKTNIIRAGLSNDQLPTKEN